MSLPEKFCIAPFKNLVVNTTGNLMPCCEYLDNGNTGAEHIVEWWNTGLTQMRDNMINGVVDENCRHCLAKEQNSEVVSHRQFLNARHNIDKIVDEYKKGIAPSVESIELRASNYCNLKCIMCGEYASSAIHQEYQQHKEKYNSLNVFMGNVKTTKWWDNEDIMSSATRLFKNVKSIRLAGGEPLLVKKLFEIAKEIQINNDCKMGVSTSLYTKDQRLIDLLLSINNLNIALSIEGIGAHNDYIRFGSEWDVIYKNLKQFKTVLCCHVLQHTSIFALPALIDFCQSENLDIELFEVFQGSYPAENVLTVNSAHPTDVEKFKTWLNNYQGKHKKLLEIWVGSYKYDPVLNQKFYEYTETFNPTYDIKL
jgi:organic radical activating enzyme